MADDYIKENKRMQVRKDMLDNFYKLTKPHLRCYDAVDTIFSKSFIVLASTDQIYYECQETYAELGRIWSIVIMAAQVLGGKPSIKTEENNYGKFAVKFSVTIDYPKDIQPTKD